MAKDKKTGLTDKQKIFCEEYIIDLNGTQAAIRAGYSKKTANEIASENLAKPNIQEYLKFLMNARAKDTQITANAVLTELAKVGFANIQDYIKKGFTVADIQELQKDHAAAIESITFEETKFGTKIKFTLHDKISALEKIGRHLGIFEKDNEQGKDNITFNVGYKKTDEES